MPQKNVRPRTSSAILYLTRIAFASFALWWMPRAVDSLQQRLASEDYAVRKPAAP